jgi:glucose-1-phosphate thymidylyltransferase
MKGIILAGGNGRRLEPITTVTNKHLLAVYDKPMIYYPLQTLLNAGINEILIVSGKEHAGGFLRLLGSGKSFKCRLQYEVQEEAGGIAQALALAESFVGDDNCTVILGDNIFEDSFAQDVKGFSGGARIFLKEVEDASRFGVATLEGEKVTGIEEKPKSPKSNLAVTGLYIYDNQIFNVIRTQKPSARGELEVTDVNNVYIKKGLMKANLVKGEWTDAGTFESLYRANTLARRLVIGK